jgi:hypothetical protein
MEELGVCVERRKPLDGIALNLWRVEGRRKLLQRLGWTIRRADSSLRRFSRRKAGKSPA